MKTKSVLRTIGLITSMVSAVPAVAYISDEGTSRIEVEMASEQKKALHGAERIDIAEAQLRIYDGGKLVQSGNVQLHTRGQSSLKEFPRKNMELKSNDRNDKGQREKFNVGKVTSSELILSASPEDLLVMRNMLVYRLYSAAKIPTLKPTYTEVIINGESQGLYMASKSPAEHILDKEDAEIVFRRRYNDEMEVKKAKKDLSEFEIAQYTEKLEGIYKAADKLKGENLLQALSKDLDVEQYLRWVALNFIVKNGDFADEVFFYAQKASDGSTRFKVFPWDLDDTFADTMHGTKIPGHINRRKEQRVNDQMIFGFESKLDQAISEDPVLMAKYFEVLEKVSNELTNEKIDELFSDVRRQLLPYLNDADILKAGQLDAVEQAHDPISVLAEFETKKEFIKSNLSHIRQELAEIKHEPAGSRAKEFNPLRKQSGRIWQKLLRQFSK